MKTLLLLAATNERNGILVKKTKNDINSCELRKVSISGRDNGYIASVNKSGAVIATGQSWRNVVNSPIEMSELYSLVESNFEQITNIIHE